MIFPNDNLRVNGPAGPCRLSDQDGFAGGGRDAERETAQS
jgi:hypothetical protein